MPYKLKPIPTRMGSKQYKKNRKNQTVTLPTIGVPVHHKFLGKPITVMFSTYTTEHINNIYNQNSAEFTFEALTEQPNLYPTLDALLDSTKNLGNKSLGVHLIVDPTKLTPTREGNSYLLEGETLPHKLGDPRGWRNPKYGALLIEDDTEQLQLMKQKVEPLLKHFNMFDDTYFIEQLIDPAGMSDSLMDAVTQKLVNYFT